MELRDEEIIGHHQLNHYIEHGPQSMANAIYQVCSSVHHQTILLSAEGLSNLLGSEDIVHQNFLSCLLEELQRLSLETTMIFTLRGVDAYVRSITIQNILYDRLSYRPSDFGSYVIDALIRSYRNLASLLTTGRVQLFRHGASVNQQILDYIVVSACGNSLDRPVLGVEHASPSEAVAMLFIWFNVNGVSVPPDFHSFLRFGQSAPSILESCFEKVLNQFPSKEEFKAHWEPSTNLMHAALGYYSMAWEFCYHSGMPNPIGQPVGPQAILTNRVGNDTRSLLSDSLLNLDFLYEIASSSVSQPIISAALGELLIAGSAEYDQPFCSMVQSI